MEKFTGKLKNGFEYEIDTTVLSSMRFLDALADIDENPLLFPKAVKMLLGAEQREALYKHIESGGEEVTAEIMGDILSEMMAAIPQGKN